MKTKVYPSGKQGATGQVVSLSIEGDKGTLADAAVLTTEFAEAGLYLVGTANNSAMVSVVNTAGTLAAQLQVTNANVTITKGTATKLNVYMEDDVLKVQNLTGASVDATVKAYI